MWDSKGARRNKKGVCVHNNKRETRERKAFHTSYIHSLCGFITYIYMNVHVDEGKKRRARKRTKYLQVVLSLQHEISRDANGTCKRDL